MISTITNNHFVNTNTKQRNDNFDKVIIFLFVFSLPFQEDTGTIAGASIPGVIAFIGLLKVLLSSNFNAVNKVLKLPIAISLLVFLVISLIIEFAHPFAFYASIKRTAGNFISAILIASLIKDEDDFKVLVSSYIISAAYLGILLFVFGWGALNSTSATSFSAANSVRDETLAQVPVSQNPNYMSYTIGVSIISIIIYLYFKVKLFGISNKLFFIGLLSLLVLSMLVTMSRTGVVCMLITLVFILIYFRQLTIKRIIVLTSICALVYSFAPQSAKTRLTVNKSQEVDDFGNIVNSDSRAVTLDESFFEIQKNFLWGSGEGNLWNGAYTKESKLAKYIEDKDEYIMSGSHNLIMQNLIQMGIFGLIFFLIIIFCVFRAMPNYRRFDFMSVIVLTFNVAAVILMFFDHISSNKEYSIAYSMAMAYVIVYKNKNTGNKVIVTK